MIHKEAMALFNTLWSEHEMRQRRLDSARAVFRELPVEDQRLFFLEIGAHLEGLALPGLTSLKSTFRAPKVARGSRTQKKTDRAEAFVFEHPEGVFPQLVATHIGQNLKTAESTLRHVAKTRGTITKRHQRWFPTGKPIAARSSVRDAIVGEFCEEKVATAKPLSTGAVYERVQKDMPSVTRATITAEINRLKKEGILRVCGSAGRGDLYEITGCIARVGPNGEPLGSNGEPLIDQDWDFSDDEAPVPCEPGASSRPAGEAGTQLLNGSASKPNTRTAGRHKTV
jgi:hypothetical protein